MTNRLHRCPLSWDSSADLLSWDSSADVVLACTEHAQRRRGRAALQQKGAWCGGVGVRRMQQEHGADVVAGYGPVAGALQLGSAGRPRADMCADMCIDMCIDICIDICIDMCIDMCADICIDMCADICIDICVDVCMMCVWTCV